MTTRNNERLFNFEDIDEKILENLFFLFKNQNHPLSIEPITTGASTSNYKITTHEDKNYLLRIYPIENDHSSLELSTYSFVKDFLNVPEVLFYDNSKINFPLAYTFLEYIEGCTLKEYLNEVAGTHLSLETNWFLLSKFMEIQTLLALINRKNLPTGWIEEVEKEILLNIYIY